MFDCPVIGDNCRPSRCTWHLSARLPRRDSAKTEGPLARFGRDSHPILPVPRGRKRVANGWARARVAPRPPPERPCHHPSPGYVVRRVHGPGVGTRTHPSVPAATLPVGPQERPAACASASAYTIVRRLADPRGGRRFSACHSEVCRHGPVANVGPCFCPVMDIRAGNALPAARLFPYRKQMSGCTPPVFRCVTTACHGAWHHRTAPSAGARPAPPPPPLPSTDRAAGCPACPGAVPALRRSGTAAAGHDG